MTLNTDTIDLRLSKYRQGWDFTRVSRIEKKILRTTLHIDAYYSQQSHGTVELWTPNGWTPVSSHPGEELHAYYTFPSIHVPTSNEDNQEEFEMVANILEGPAITMLTGD